MASLFLDTSNKVTFGVLDERFRWLRFNVSEDKKASKALHSLINQALEDLSIELGSLESVFYISGPGSYTGVRVAQGFAEVLEWQGMNVFSCRHFDLPLLLGVKKGAFISRAFKQEAFLYEWNGKSNSSRLLAETEAQSRISKLSEEGTPCFTSEQDFYNGCESTYDLIEKDCERLFSHLSKAQMKSEVFYYRSLEEEFSKGK